MSLNRRSFLTAAAGLAAAGFVPNRYGASVAFAKAPDPNNPNDPNAITDPDHEIGKPYVGWKEGELDLHFIHTGVGENMFHIFPDGTTMLLDTGDRDYVNYKTPVPVKPDESRRPGEWVARYIKRIRPDIDAIDYVMASHSHPHHVGHGKIGAGMTTDREPNYQISGIAHVGEFYHFKTAFDRGYPGYDKPTPWAPDTRENIVKFWEYKEKTDGLKREEFIVGALDQIKLLNSPGKYDFHTRNICRNGVVWGGEGKENVDFFALNPENIKQQNENTRSLALTYRFGDFVFYTGGDASGALQTASGADAGFEGAVGRAAGKVDVCKANHHTYKDAMTRAFTDAVDARVYIMCVWTLGHLQDNTESSMVLDADGAPRDKLVCPTAIHAANAEMMQGKAWRPRLVERGGHVVVKAYDGGAKYKVYFLTAEDESMNVELVFGPFDSSKKGGAV